jgi:hypothetical protein
LINGRILGRSKRGEGEGLLDGNSMQSLTKFDAKHMQVLIVINALKSLCAALQKLNF